MMIPFLVSKIHRAKVTSTDLDYYGSISIDEEIMKEANLREYQKVEIYDITNGSRLNTYVIPAPAGSRDIILNGAAAHLVNTGDIIIIAAYALIDERELDTRNSVVLLMNDKDNSIDKVINGKL
jgi:aspartate 1-decarboxylase